MGGCGCPGVGQRQIQTIERSEQLPGNTVRRENVLLKRSLDNLDTYLRMAAKGRRDPISSKAAPKGGTVLKQVMSAQGLEWRDSDDVLPRWRMAYFLNPKARAGIESIQTRARVAEHIEKVISEDRAFAHGTRNGQLSARSKYRLRVWLKLGREFANSFEDYYPSR